MNKLNIVVALGILLIGITYSIYKNEIFSKEKVYTIGHINKIYTTASFEYNAEYTYWINGKAYLGQKNLHGFENKVKVNDRYLVAISLGHWDYSDMYLDKPIPDTVKAPIKGWKDLSQVRVLE